MIDHDGWSSHWTGPAEPRGCACGGDESSGHRTTCVMNSCARCGHPYPACSCLRPAGRPGGRVF